MSISFANVCFAYKKKLVLQDISVEIRPKELVGIIGPNGGGKSSFLHLCTGYLRAQKGLIDVQTNKKHGIGLVPQNVHYDPNFPITVFEIVLSAFILQAKPFGRYPKTCKKQALMILESLGLIAYKDAPFGSLSTGLAQRTLVARALVDNPEILLLDEPTSSVDPEARKAILKIIGSLKGKMTILFVTHDLEIAIHNMDRVLCLEKTLSSFLPHEVCQHFGIGLYHAPFKTKE